MESLTNSARTCERYLEGTRVEQCRPLGALGHHLQPGTGTGKLWEIAVPSPARYHGGIDYAEVTIGLERLTTLADAEEPVATGRVQRPGQLAHRQSEPPTNRRGANKKYPNVWRVGA